MHLILNWQHSLLWLHVSKERSSLNKKKNLKVQITQKKERGNKGMKRRGKKTENEFKMVDVNPSISIIILHVNALNTPIKRDVKIDFLKILPNKLWTTYKKIHFKYNDIGKLKVKRNKTKTCKHESKEIWSGNINNWKSRLQSKENHQG